MSDTLEFNSAHYQVKTLELKGSPITYRSFGDLLYVENPVYPEFQKMNLFVPEGYYHGETINGFSAETAPIFFPNAVGAYAAGRADQPGFNFRLWARDQVNSLFVALQKGFVVAAPASRGRSLQDRQGHFVGCAPAAIVDLKAAVRYLRRNRGRFPGDTERIISNGTSAGGALSALLGTTGNCPDYEPYLEKLGAANERDDIFAASCFCPIMNLEHADMAYEWLLEGLDEFHSLRFHTENGKVIPEPFEGLLTSAQKDASRELRQMFISYLNGLDLKDGNGMPLRLGADGLGSFREHLSDLMRESAQTALDHGGDLSCCPNLHIEEGKAVTFHLDGHVKAAGRMKPVPAFDDWENTSAENELFGTAASQFQHFTKYGLTHDTGGGSLAQPELVRMMNPMEYLDGKTSDTARHWRIRHGSLDCHTSWAIPLIFAEKLKQYGKNVDFQFAWGKEHCGDYNMDQMFAWMKDVALQ